MPFIKGNRLWDNPNTKSKQFSKGQSASPNTQFKKGLVHSEKWLASQKARTGEKNPAWKGGITPLNKKLRKSDEYKVWREQVFKRDDYTCQGCGANGYIQAHHIKAFSHYKDLIYELSNGITLCESCHSLTDNYKGRANKKV